jgi:ATP-dependent exoDNAse (exonuclease V) alpha subunit
MQQGRWYDYDKPDVVHTAILAPEGTPGASFVFDRQTLWNVVERAEKRVDAQLAREVEITLPRELDRDQQIALVHAFVRDEFTSKGMVADIAIHEPLAADERAQPHAHVLLTLRRLDAATETGFAATKERDWNEREDVARAVAEARKRFNNTGLPEDKEALEKLEAQRQVNLWRASWAAYANRALEEVGSRARIDHRTLEKQGIARKPQQSLGLARHVVDKAYTYLKDRITNWVAIKKRASLYQDVEHYQQRDPVKLADFLLRLNDMAEDFAASFRKGPDIPEASLDR